MVMADNDGGGGKVETIPCRAPHPALTTTHDQLARLHNTNTANHKLNVTSYIYDYDHTITTSIKSYR
jgi:hypothetical protein